MKFRQKFSQLKERWKNRKKRFRKSNATLAVKSLLESFTDEWMEQSFRLARERTAPDLEDLPADFKLRQSGPFRRFYEWLFPVSHVSKISFAYGRESIQEFFPIDKQSYIGRGSYKFVYKLPWQMVIKVAKPILNSDPLLGSLYREVASQPDKFLDENELDLLHFLNKGASEHRKQRNEFQFHRLALERYSYWKVREALPDMVLPTRFFMGVQFRKMPLRGQYKMRIRPMDSQIMLIGKHLKEFAVSGTHSEQGKIRKKFFPKYDFQFDIGRFGKIKKKTLVKIQNDFFRLIEYTQKLATDEKLILDIHTENLIITLPEFELKVFDFHIFDEHLYEPSLKFDRPDKDHIEVIEKFIESFDLKED